MSEVSQTPGPGPEEGRLALIRALQTPALAKPDPLVANLQVLNADLMLLAHRARELTEAALAGGQGPAEQEQFFRRAELYLKVVRQIDRLASLTRQLPAPGRPRASAAASARAGAGEERPN
jgi:hypothetical protein